MNKAARKAKLLRVFHCGICHENVKDVRVCPRCSRLYCNKCIQTWLTKSGSCPNCRADIGYKDLVKGCSINEIRESFSELLGFLDRNLCDQHEQELTLYCYSCEVNICVKCLYATDHVDHKEQVVPVDEAYDHYKQNLKTDLLWIKGRKDIIRQGLEQVAEMQQQLNDENEQIEDLCEESEQLLAGEASPVTLVRIRNTVKQIAKLRTEQEHDTEAIRIDRRGEFILEPAVVVFCMDEFTEIIADEDKYELRSKDSHGLVWLCTVTEWNLDDDDAVGEDGNYFCYLSLMAGVPGDYSVSLNKQPEKVLSFELNKDVLIGYVVRNIENDTCQVTVEIRQTYADRIKQLQERVAQLEKQCNKQKSFKSLLSDYEKIMESESD